MWQIVWSMLGKLNGSDNGNDSPMGEDEISEKWCLFFLEQLYLVISTIFFFIWCGAFSFVLI